jgi:6-phosphogluconolactonase (cycloisomerase 2 family)
MASNVPQISFTRDGHALVITERSTNTITTYTVKENGKPGIMHTLPSANAVPFGLAAGRNNIIYVSEQERGSGCKFIIFLSYYAKRKYKAC